MAENKIKAVFINHSDTAGGASVVAMRLIKALGGHDVDARMIVMNKNTSSLRVAEAAPRWRQRLSFLAEHADIYMHNGRNRDTLFRISTAKYGLPLHRHAWVRDADVVVLNWINQGMLSLDRIRKISAMGKPIVWIMHDLWNATGVCHYTARCNRYTTGCGNCPLLGPGAAPRDLSAQTFDCKKALYGDVPIHFVAVSHGLADTARTSPLMAGADLSIIPNAFPIHEFATHPALTRNHLGLPEGKRLVVMGAARLDDPVKNLPLAVEALNNTSTPDIAAVFYGAIRNPDILAALKIPYVALGHIDNFETIKSIMAHASVILSTSLWETLPGTLVEGLAAGAVAVATHNGGQADIVVDDTLGYLVDDNATALGSAIDRAMTLAHTTGDEGRRNRHADIAALFGADKVARRYADLFEKLVTRPQTLRKVPKLTPV